MAKKMLIDATHAEETRVVVVDGTKVEEFDFETINRRQISGNIYLAKVTRVEPSLQAAFVDYGGNRHGFLAFAEIHPDYYQIPAADRAVLIAEEQAYAEAQEAEETGRSKRRSRPAKAEKAESTDEAVVAEVSDELSETAETDDENADGSAAAKADDADRDHDAADQGEADAASSATDDGIESVAEEDVSDEIRAPKKARPRRYKIQEVVKVRQIMLVQVVKEERGNKGAALTTYLSLAGRYCVLMPNTARGGGISRKITNIADRKKLKDIASELDVPKGAGLIIRTAGSQRTRTEIRRDYEYLLRLWEQIRDLTFKSIAPAAIYEEGDLIKRSIRDLYGKDIDEVLVEGERGYRVAKDFMKMIMPSHAKNVKHYGDVMPLFARYQAESYLAGMFNPVVQLKSGGYIVIGVTEALVAIDVNSGRATKEGSIEDTALKTNLEASDEVARQLRLRDLAGLIVIDFIDMEERKNNAAVEKRLKDKLKSDRARIQIGRISGFGLMEMSRQRLRPGMLESTTQPCAHCHGTGLIRSDDSLALMILREIEEEGTRKRSREVLLRAPIKVVNFLINSKREHIAGIEARYGLSIRLEADPSLISPDFALEKFKTATRSVPETLHAALSVDADLMAQIDDEDQVNDEDEADEDDVKSTEPQSIATEDDDAQGGRNRRRRRRRRRKPGDRSDEGGNDASAGDVSDEREFGSAPDAADTDGGDVTAEPAVARSITVEAISEITELPPTGQEPEPAAIAGEGDEAAVAKKAARKPRSRAPRAEKAKPTVKGDVSAAEPPVPEPRATALPEVVDLRETRDHARADDLPDAPAPAGRKPRKPAAGRPQSRAVAEPSAAEISPEPEVVAPVADTTPETTDVTGNSTSKDEPLDAVAEKQASPDLPEDAAAPAQAPDAPSQRKRRGWWSGGA